MTQIQNGVLALKMENALWKLFEKEHTFELKFPLFCQGAKWNQSDTSSKLQNGQNRESSSFRVDLWDMLLIPGAHSEKMIESELTDSRLEPEIDCHFFFLHTSFVTNRLQLGALCTFVPKGEQTQP